MTRQERGQMMPCRLVGFSSLVSSSGDSQVIFGDGGECIPSINIA